VHPRSAWNAPSRVTREDVGRGWETDSPVSPPRLANVAAQGRARLTLRVRWAVIVRTQVQTEAAGEGRCTAAQKDTVRCVVNTRVRPHGGWTDGPSARDCGRRAPGGTRRRERGQGNTLGDKKQDRRSPFSQSRQRRRESVRNSTKTAPVTTKIQSKHMQSMRRQAPTYGASVTENP